LWRRATRSIVARTGRGTVSDAKRAHDKVGA
jgi:hypothetical protein